MSAAPARLLAAAQRSTGGLGIIGITGPVGAGKSTLARAVSVCVLSTDDYLPDYDLVAYDQRDNPAHMDTDLLLENLAALRAGRSARVPVWSFQSHRREGYREVTPPVTLPEALSGAQPAAQSISAAAIVCEGIHALYSPIAAVLDVSVYVDAPSTVRWARWEHLERTGVRGWGVERARVFFDQVAEPAFAARAQAYRAAAHFVVINDG